VDFIKVIGGLILASIGFVGIAVAVMRYFIGKIQDVLYMPLDLSGGSLIAIGVISLIVFLCGVYIIIRYGGRR
jgi:hypothetical protein